MHLNADLRGNVLLHCLLKQTDSVGRCKSDHRNRLNLMHLPSVQTNPAKKMSCGHHWSGDDWLKALKVVRRALV